MFLLFQGIIFRFQPLIFQGVMEKKRCRNGPPPEKTDFDPFLRLAPGWSWHAPGVPPVTRSPSKQRICGAWSDGSDGLLSQGVPQWR